MGCRILSVQVWGVQCGAVYRIADLGAGCDKNGLMGDGIKYGQARYAHGGTVVR